MYTEINILTVKEACKVSKIWLIDQTETWQWPRFRHSTFDKYPPIGLG